MFDNLVILTRGSPVYSGKAFDCLPWFEKNDKALPPFVNPAEFLIDIAAIDNRTPELETMSTQRVEGLKLAWIEESRRIYDTETTEKTASPLLTTSTAHAHGHQHSPFIRQTKVLTARTILVTLRDPLGMVGSLVEATGVRLEPPSFQQLQLTEIDGNHIWLGVLPTWKRSIRNKESRRCSLYCSGFARLPDSTLRNVPPNSRHPTF